MTYDNSASDRARRANAIRSLLYTPADHERKVVKVDHFGADAIVLDLEDAVAMEHKVAARDLIQPALATMKNSTRCVRVNDFTTGLTYGDIGAVVGENLDILILPKVESPEHLILADREISRLEAERGLTPGAIQMIPLVETAVGLMRAYEIAMAAPPRMPRLNFGLGDFSVDINVSITEQGLELLYARSKLVIASRAARLAPPLDGPFLDIHNDVGLRQNTKQSRELGLHGRVCVYPKQVDTVNDVYAKVTPEELVRAKRIVEVFEEAEKAGSASIQIDGEFVDYPLYNRCVQMLKDVGVR